MYLGVIIAAGGQGTRMAAGGSKQLLLLAGKPVLARTVELFDNIAEVREIVIAIEAADVERCRQEIVNRLKFAKVVAVVPGGDTRSQSVANAFDAFSAAVDTVAVHDGARPLFPPELLAAGLAELSGDRCDGVVYGLPAIDTVKEVDASGLVRGTPDRGSLRAVQTPQIFPRQVLARALAAGAEALKQATDDAALVERAGGRVKVIAGSPENIKLTTPLDLTIAEAILKSRAEAHAGGGAR